MTRRFCCFIICAALLCGALAGCGQAPAAPKGDPALSAAVLYDGAANDGRWEDVLSHLEQALLMGLTAEAVDVSKGWDLSGYDILYPDESIMACAGAETLRQDVKTFAGAGGGVFLTNGFKDYFGADFVGAREFVKIDGCPADLSYPWKGMDLNELQGVLKDYETLFAADAGFETLSRQDYGWGVKCSSAEPLVKMGGVSLYTMNNYGDGWVFYTNPLLPSEYFTTGFSLTSRAEDSGTFSNTAASCSQLLENTFASFICKQRCGYSLWRVFGSFGRPSMAWELHFEEMTGFQNGSGIEFAELCKAAGQVPSYTLIRSTYVWFLRAESVSYLLGQSDGGFKFDMEESAYSSGAHVAAGGKWLSQSEIADGKSYFEEHPEFDFRAYPWAGDADGDGLVDIICGSADGYIYYYRGTGFEERLTTEAAVKLTDESGRPLTVQSYSAPVLADWDSDGEVDIISGAGDGSIYIFRGLGGMKFQAAQLLLETGLQGQSLPDAGDLDGDGVLDLAVGSNEGVLKIYCALASEPAVTVDTSDISGEWLAPRIHDLDGDGKNDLAVGTAAGRVSMLISDGVSFSCGGSIELDERGRDGTYAAQFGNNCVPFFADIDGDGLTDLLCGALEYGMAYPIDSEYLPCKEELRESIDYIVKNGFYLGIHFFTNVYASEAREAYELARHREAMEYFGVSLSLAGANHHTWNTAAADLRQSFIAEWDAGLLWDSGYMPAGRVSNTPHYDPENVISLPFFLTVDGERTLLMQNCCTLLYSDDTWTDISAGYDIPVCIYYHCDFTARDPESAQINIDRAEAFRRAHAYNFTGEDQLMLASAAAYNLTASVENGVGEGFDITLTAGHESEDFPLYSADYQRSCGIRVSLGAALRLKTIVTDADVWYRDGDDLYVAANKPVRVYETADYVPECPIQQVNVAADIETGEGWARIDFLDGGMMQVSVRGAASTEDEGWTVTNYNGLTVFTRYGDAAGLTLQY